MFAPSVKGWWFDPVSGQVTCCFPGYFFLGLHLRPRAGLVGPVRV